MGHDCYNKIVISGPAYAIEMIDRFCKGRVFGHINCEVTQSVQVSDTCRYYEYDSHNYPDRWDYFQLRSLFPAINIYYFVLEECDISADSCEDGIRRKYTTPFELERSFGIITKDPDVSKLLTVRREWRDGFDEYKPHRIGKYDTQMSRRRFLTEDPVKLSKERVLDRVDLITILLRSDSLEVLDRLGRVKLIEDYEESDEPSDTYSGSYITPLMVAAKIGKLDEYRLLKKNYPKFLRVKAGSDDDLLQYCKDSGDSELYRVIVKT